MSLKVLGFAAVLFTASSCTVVHELGHHDATACPCPDAPNGCWYEGEPACGACRASLVCEERCEDVTCDAGSRCCSCNGCVPFGEECPGRPLWCADEEAECRYEGTTVCNCGRYICEGECDGLVGGECEPGFFCNFTDGCGLQQESGMCDRLPTSCSSTCEPVCGCDGNTYCNTCEANRIGIDVAAPGPCP